MVGTVYGCFLHAGDFMEQGVRLYDNIMLIVPFFFAVNIIGNRSQILL